MVCDTNWIGLVTVDGVLAACPSHKGIGGHCPNSWRNRKPQMQNLIHLEICCWNRLCKCVYFRYLGSIQPCTLLRIGAKSETEAEKLECQFSRGYKSRVAKAPKWLQGSLALRAESQWRDLQKIRRPQSRHRQYGRLRPCHSEGPASSALEIHSECPLRTAGSTGRSSFEGLPGGGSLSKTEMSPSQLGLFVWPWSTLGSVRTQGASSALPGASPLPLDLERLRDSLPWCEGDLDGGFLPLPSLLGDEVYNLRCLSQVSCTLSCKRTSSTVPCATKISTFTKSPLIKCRIVLSWLPHTALFTMTTHSVPSWSQMRSTRRNTRSCSLICLQRIHATCLLLMRLKLAPWKSTTSIMARTSLLATRKLASWNLSSMKTRLPGVCKVRGGSCTSCSPATLSLSMFQWKAKASVISLKVTSVTSRSITSLPNKYIKIDLVGMLVGVGVPEAMSALVCTKLMPSWSSSCDVSISQYLPQSSHSCIPVFWGERHIVDSRHAEGAWYEHLARAKPHCWSRRCIFLGSPHIFFPYWCIEESPALWSASGPVWTSFLWSQGWHMLLHGTPHQLRWILDHPHASHHPQAVVKSPGLQCLPDPLVDVELRAWQGGCQCCCHKYLQQFDEDPSSHPTVVLLMLDLLVTGKRRPSGSSAPCCCHHFCQNHRGSSFSVNLQAKLEPQVASKMMPFLP